MADVASHLRVVQVPGTVKLDDLVVGTQPFEGIAHVRHHLIARSLLLFLSLVDGVLRPSDFALVAIEERQLNLSEERCGIQVRDVGVVNLRRDVLLADGLLQFILAIRRGDTLHGGTKVGPRVDGFHLQIFEAGAQRDVIERAGHVVVRRNGLVT